MEEKKTWWESKGWMVVLGGLILLAVISVVLRHNDRTTPSTTTNTQPTPRNADGTITQLKIAASANSRSIAFASQEDYTNCNDSLTVITMDGNQQPMFTTYKDNSSSINLFAGDQHSIAYGSLISDNGNSLIADINAGTYGDNTSGTWGLVCDQGQYGLTVSTIK